MKKLLFSLVATLCVTSAFADSKSGINYDNMNPTINPGTDFAQFATGKWILNNPQPATYPAWGVTTKLYDDNIVMLSSMIRDIAAQKNEQGCLAQKIGDLYNCVMDTARLNREGATPVMPYLKRVKRISSREELCSYLAGEHMSLFWGISIAPDSKDSRNNIVCISQGGLSLGDRDYYLNDDEQSIKMRDAFREHAINLFLLCGYKQKVAEQKVATIMALETEIARASYSKELLRDPDANYHKMSVDKLMKISNGFDWKKYLSDYSFGETTEVDLGQPEPVAVACKLMMSAPLEDLKSVLEFRTIANAANCLSEAFDKENLNYRNKFMGQTEQQPRWKIAVGTVSNLMDNAIGRMFVEKYFSPESKAVMLEMIGNLQSAFRNRILAQEWMSDATKQIAVDKLDAFRVKVGYPDKWDDLSGLDISADKSLYENMMTAQRFYWDLYRAKRYNKPVDRDEWLMSAHTVNAYYNPSTNEICFPAGFLQAPVFNVNYDAATNYGAIGAVIGHEMTHGFDDEGRKMDKDGNLNQWWTKEDAEKFNATTAKLADYFDSLWVIPNELHANGKLCLGENIADQGGINIAYDAFQMWQKKHGRLPDETVVIDGKTYTFTPEQRFFISYATTWAGVYNDDLRRYITKMDVHSVDDLRVNGALPNVDAWYDAFNIPVDSPLYVAPTNRARVW